MFISSSYRHRNFGLSVIAMIIICLINGYSFSQLTEVFFFGCPQLIRDENLQCCCVFQYLEKRFKSRPAKLTGTLIMIVQQVSE